MNSEVTLRIHSIKCVDETGGKWDEKFGNDEMFLAGYAIGDDLEPIFVKPFEVYAHFDDGETKGYSPPRSFVTLPLNGDGSFPKANFVAFLLAEKDRGDFNDKALSVYNEIVEELAKKKREELGNGSNFAAGDEIKKKILEKLFEETYAWVRNKIITTANDEIFPLRYKRLTVTGPESTFNGSQVSPSSSVEFRGHDGFYLLTYDWQLS